MGRSVVLCSHTYNFASSHELRYSFNCVAPPLPLSYVDLPLALERHHHHHYIYSLQASFLWMKIAELTSASDLFAQYDLKVSVKASLRGMIQICLNMTIVKRILISI